MTAAKTTGQAVADGDLGGREDAEQHTGRQLGGRDDRGGAYGPAVSPGRVSAATDRVPGCLAERESRPPDSVSAGLFSDGVNVKLRGGQVAGGPIDVVLGVTADGERGILGLWA